MKSPFIVLFSLAHLSGLWAEAIDPNVGSVKFKYVRYDANSGALYRSVRGNSRYNNSVRSVFVDSMGRVWIGTVTGLAVFDGKQWNSRTFEKQMLSEKGQNTIKQMDLGDSGPTKIIEGPAGTIWFAGPFGIWRHRNNRYEEMTAKITLSLAIAVDNTGGFWAVQKRDVHRFDGESWRAVLSPFAGQLMSPEAPGLYGVVIDRDQSVWIGGTSYGELTGPWKYQGAAWNASEEPGTDNRGPPIAPLFQFAGGAWSAYGPPHGLDVKSAIPEIDDRGQIRVKTPMGYYERIGDNWKPSKDLLIAEAKRWVLRTGGSNSFELFFREGNRLHEVRPTESKTGKPWSVVRSRSRATNMAEGLDKGSVWLGTSEGVYKIWRE